MLIIAEFGIHLADQIPQGSLAPGQELPPFQGHSVTSQIMADFEEAIKNVATGPSANLEAGASVAATEIPTTTSPEPMPQPISHTQPPSSSNAVVPEKITLSPTEPPQAPNRRESTYITTEHKPVSYTPIPTHQSMQPPVYQQPIPQQPLQQPIYQHQFAQQAPPPPPSAPIYNYDPYTQPAYYPNATPNPHTASYYYPHQEYQAPSAYPPVENPPQTTGNSSGSGSNVVWDGQRWVQANSSNGGNGA
jgi:hypothetical protein